MNEDRILAMSAFEAAYLIRSFRDKNAELSTHELIATARAVRTDFFSHDYQAGIELEREIAADMSSTMEAFFTAAIESVIANRSPVWARLAPAGRNHVLQAIGTNGVQCMRAAGLLGTDERATAWWDGLASAKRGERDARLLAQGREGERRSLAYERVRLSDDGIEREPIWVAIDDNRVGYDILSYSWHEGSETNRLIEVKTSSADPAQMILTRNEWLTAEQYEPAFEFHVWNLRDGGLAIYKVEDIRRHIPTDNGDGIWDSVTIRF